MSYLYSSRERSSPEAENRFGALPVFRFRRCSDIIVLYLRGEVI
jgi:hypothetical protein